MRCGQGAALNIPLGAGKTLRYATKLQKNGVAWSAIGAGDCHDVALKPVSLTVQQGAVTRRLTAPDQCNPAGAKRVSTKDWELVLKNGGFALRALTRTRRSRRASASSASARAVSPPARSRSSASTSPCA